MVKVQTNMRLSKEARSFLAKLATKFAISHTAIIELAVRKMAKEEGVK